MVGAASSTASTPSTPAASSPASESKADSDDTPAPKKKRAPRKKKSDQPAADTPQPEASSEAPAETPDPPADGERKITFAELNKAILAYCKANTTPVGIELVHSITGVKKVKEIPEDKYADVLAAIELAA